MGSILFTAFSGAIAGLLAWVVMEPSSPRAFEDSGATMWGLKFALLMGGLIAGTLGALYGWQRGSRRQMFLGMALGFFVGGMFSSFGLAFGGTVAHALFPGFDRGISANTTVGRLFEVVPAGTLIGAAVGISARNFKQVMLGIVGGTLGGVTAALLFDPISFATGQWIQSARGGNEVGMAGRAALATILGGAIGLFVSLARAVAKTAWLRLSLGRNEGREWVVDAAQTYIGRSEAAQVPIFGDPNIAPMHACITRQGPHYWLMDGGTPTGTRLNGQPVQQAPLFHGAQIGIGSVVLEFLMRAGSAPARASEQLKGGAVPVMPIQTGAAPAATSPLGLPQISALVAVSGPLTGQRFPLLGPIEIGREASGISLPFDATASRRHARVEPIAGGWQVVDLGSTNGTFLDGVRVQTAPFHLGDVLQIGAVSFRVE